MNHHSYLYDDLKEQQREWKLRRREDKVLWIGVIIAFVGVGYLIIRSLI